MKINVFKPVVKNKLEKKRVCAYARVSFDGYMNGESLKSQMEYYEKVISENPEYEFAGVFADKGISRATKNRPQFSKMLELCREGKIDKIYTKSISRFARNTLIILELVRELK